ncbi:MAG: PilZ domain-containing protein [Thermoanaerobaculia bacterium]
MASEEEARYFFGTFLDRTGLPALRVDSGQQCLEAASQESFGLICARIPLPDLSLPALASGLTQRFSLSGDAPLLVLAEGKQYEAALAFQTSRIQIVDISRSAGEVAGLIRDALGIAIRAAARLDVELEVETDNAADRRHCRTRDISRTGMLLDSTEPLPVGTEFVFNFTLPERFTPIHGRGQVVRHEGSPQSPRAGMGVRFIDFPEGAEDAIETFVEQNRLYARP